MDAFQFRKLATAPVATDTIAVYATGTLNPVANLTDLAGAALANPFTIADAGGVDAWGFRTASVTRVDVLWVEGDVYLGVNVTVGDNAATGILSSTWATNSASAFYGKLLGTLQYYREKAYEITPLGAGQDIVPIELLNGPDQYVKLLANDTTIGIPENLADSYLASDFLRLTIDCNGHTGTTFDEGVYGLEWQTPDGNAPALVTTAGVLNILEFHHHYGYGEIPTGKKWIGRWYGADVKPASQTQAEDSTGTTLLGWTATRIWQAIAKWGVTVTSVFKGVLQAQVEKVQTTITGSVTSIDWSLGHVVIDYAGNTSLSAAPPFTNVPTGGRAYLHIMFKHNGGARTFGINATYLKSTLTLAGTSGGWDIIVLWTDDGGTNIYGQVVESK